MWTGDVVNPLEQINTCAFCFDRLNHKKGQKYEGGGDLGYKDAP